MPTQTTGSWNLAQPDVDSVLQQYPLPLEALAAASIPAIVLRGAVPADECQRLIERMIAQELLYDPAQPIPEKFREAAIPEGYYREGRNAEAAGGWREKTSAGRARIDVGTSLGYRGSDREQFLAHSAESLALFERLFENQLNPIQRLYEELERLSVNKRVVTAYEPDGRRYGPAIIRAHYGGYTYRPHFDSVRLREKRDDYAVYQFDHQFAGVLVLQNTQQGDKSAQCVLHRCLWEPEVDPYLQDGNFYDYAEQRGIENIEVCLEPGDLYFFNTRCIHEVPGVAGELPRIVLATFIGFSADRDEIFVWS